MFHVIKNSIAPSPLIQAKLLDRLDPSARERCIREWRSFRGGVHLEDSRSSTPPSPALETPVEMYTKSTGAAELMEDEFVLNVITDNYLRHNGPGT